MFFIYCQFTEITHVHKRRTFRPLTRSSILLLLYLGYIVPMGLGPGV